MGQITTGQIPKPNDDLHQWMPLHEPGKGPHQPHAHCRHDDDDIRQPVMSR